MKKMNTFLIIKKTLNLEVKYVVYRMYKKYLSLCVLWLCYDKY